MTYEVFEEITGKLIGRIYDLVYEKVEDGPEKDNIFHALQALEDALVEELNS